MIFDILSSKVSVSEWGDQKGSVSLSLDVVPHGREYIDIGADYILCAAGHLPMRDEKRTPIEASVTITSDPEQINHLKSGKPFIGCAEFSPARERDFDSPAPAMLGITVVLEPDRFNRLLDLRIPAPATATLHVNISGLSFGWEPDGSHQVWKLDDAFDCGEPDCRRITSFWISVETFWTHERAVSEIRDNRQNVLLAQSPDENDRKLASTSTAEPDSIAKLLKQCRALLIAIVALAALALITAR